jgi:hypothetical protein
MNVPTRNVITLLIVSFFSIALIFSYSSCNKDNDNDNLTEGCEGYFDQQQHSSRRPISIQNDKVFPQSQKTETQQIILDHPQSPDKFAELFTPLYHPIFKGGQIPKCAIRYFENAIEQEKERGVLSSRGNFFHPRISQVLMVHYSKSTKRRETITKLLKKHNVLVSKWILDFDRENVTNAMRECFHDSTKGFHFSSASSSQHFLFNNSKKAARMRPRDTLNAIQSSVIIKHYYALYLAATQSKEDSEIVHPFTKKVVPKYTLILEDDVFLRNGFAVHFDTLIKELEDATNDSSNGDSLFDVLMIGGCLNMHANRRRGSGIKFPAPKVSAHTFLRQEARCAHAYVVSRDGAQKIMNSMPLTHPIDFQLNAAFKEEDLKVLWVEPWLAIQGDIDGGCVTASIYKGKCPSVEKNPGREFDVKFMESTAENF